MISAGLAPVHNNSTSCTANDSTWMCPQDYLNRLNLLRVAIDGVGLHLYPIQTSAITASSALSDIQNEYKAIESIDQKKLGARPIWVTETGVKTNNYVSGSLQGSITMTYRDWLTAQSDLAGVYVWNIIDDSNGTHLWRPEQERQPKGRSTRHVLPNRGPARPDAHGLLIRPTGKRPAEPCPPHV